MNMQQLFNIQDNAAAPIDALLKKAHSAKSQTAKGKHINQARELVASGNIAYTVTELEWMIENLEWLY